MVHEHLKGLRLDKRVLRRRDWITPAELKREIGALVDVADKVDDTVPEPATPPAEGSKA
jgi:hypothetical protein